MEICIAIQDGKKGDGGAQGKSRAIVWKMTNPNILQGAEATTERTSWSIVMENYC